MATGDPIVRHVVTFGRVLREVGLEVGPGRVIDGLRALDAVDLTRQEDVYFALRQTLVSRQDELDLFDRAFLAWFLRAPVIPPQRLVKPVPQLQRLADTLADKGSGEEVGGDDPLELGASGQELLREKDFGEMSADEFRRVRRLMLEIARRRPQRSSRRRTADPRGELLDMRRMIRKSLRTGGDAVDRAFRTRKRVPRKLVVLCDVSGSMDSYARALLLFLHAVVGSGSGVEAFAFGTRLSRLTPDLGTRDPEAALEKCTAAVVDWGSGTRIGASLKEFNDTWGKRALSRGAVVVVVSDGWEREDPALVGREMAKIGRAAYAVVWVNPLKGNPEYQPLAGGMRAALPHVDRFLAGHNLRSLEELAAVLAGIERRHAA
ncbi:MAG: VWA domain-containing protein [Actinobacteria bacterium]|nr:VWA domain-containing protein [Actinomycetota bacterium]